MISIEIDGEFLDLPSDFELVMVVEGLVMNEGDITVPRTYEVSFPPSPKNLRLCGFIHEMRRANITRTLNHVVRSNGVQIMKGLLKLSSFDGEIHGVLTDSVIMESLKLKRLNDFEIDTDLVLGATTQDVADYALTDHPSDGVGFPEILMSDPYDEQNPNFCKSVNLRNSGSSGHVNVVDYTVLEQENVYALLPCFHILWLLQKIGVELGLTFSGSLFSKAELEDLLMLGTKLLDEKGVAENINTGTKTSKTMTGLQGLEYDTITGSEWNTGSYPEYRWVTPNEGNNRFALEMDVVATSASGYDLRVELYLYIDSIEQEILYTDLVDGVTTHLSYRLEDMSFITGTTYHWKINFSENTPGGWGDVAGTYSNVEARFEGIAYEGLNVYKKSLVYNEYLPKMLLGDFVKTIAKSLNVGVSFDDLKREVSFDLIEDLIDDTDFWDITDKVISGGKVLYDRSEIVEAEGFEIKFDKDSKVDSYIYGSGGKTTELELSPCTELVTNGFWVDLPEGIDMWRYDTTLTSDLTDAVGEFDGLRICYHDKANQPMKLTLEDEPNTFLTELLKDSYITKDEAEPYEFRVDFNENDLIKVKKSQKFMIDHTLFFLKRLTTAVGKNGVKVSKLEVMKI